MNEYDLALLRELAWCRVRAEAALKQLLETKHLYQSVKVDVDTPFDNRPADDPKTARAAREHARRLLAQRWGLEDKADQRPRLSGSLELEFAAPDATLYCASCGRVEAFNSVFGLETAHRGGLAQSTEAGVCGVGVFVLTYQCQSCKGLPEVFLVRQEGQKLTLAGRAPIEHVDVPAAIPSSVRKWYSGAVVAFQSGQALAGLFLLRILVEQWAREKAELRADELADVALERYMATLPGDFKDRFPSLRDLYSRLSVDIHAAAGSEDLFREAIAAVDKHFDARRVFRL